MRYWVGGTGTWNASDTTHWAASSGGAGGETVPSSTDDVYFDSSSSTANAAYTVTTGGTINCQNLSVDGPGAGNKVTWVGTSAYVNVYGNIDLLGGTAGITSTTINLTAKPTSGTKTIKTYSVPIANTIINPSTGATVQLLDDLSVRIIFQHAGGTFDANSRAVILTGSTPSLLTLAGTTFYDLTMTPTTPTKSDVLSLSQNITVSNLFTLSDGATATNRILVQSSVVGTPRTITAAAISISNADFQDITGAGAASWDMSAAVGGSGNCGGNTMKALGDAAFTTATTETWTNTNGGSWSGAANWTSRVPLPQDDVSMNCAFGTSKTVTVDMPRMGKSIDFTGATWTTALTWSMTTPIMYGSLTLISGLTVSGSSLTFSGRSSYTLESKEVVMTTSIAVSAFGGSITLIGDLSLTTIYFLTVSIGTFSAVNGSSNYAVSASAINASNVASNATLTLGSATHLLNGTGLIMNIAANSIITSFTGTLKVTNTTNTANSFTGGGKTYGNLWFDRGASTASNNINSTNTFVSLKDTGTAAHSLIFAAGTTQTVGDFIVSGSLGKEITINSTSTATHALVKSGGGTITCNFLNIQHSVATPINTWYAKSSTNNQSVATAGSGWTFSVINLKTITSSLVLSSVNFNRIYGLVVVAFSISAKKIKNIFNILSKAAILLSSSNYNIFKGIVNLTLSLSASFSQFRSHFKTLLSSLSITSIRNNFVYKQFDKILILSFVKKSLRLQKKIGVIIILSRFTNRAIFVLLNGLVYLTGAFRNLRARILRANIELFIARIIFSKKLLQIKIYLSSQSSNFRDFTFSIILNLSVNSKKIIIKIFNIIIGLSSTVKEEILAIDLEATIYAISDKAKKFIKKLFT